MVSRMNQYVGNLPPMPGVFPDYPAPVIRNAGDAEEMVMMRWGMPPPPRTGGPPVTKIVRAKQSDHWFRSTIAREFGMKQGLAVVRVRRALLFYLLDEMRLLAAVRRQDKDMADVPVWVKNARQVASELSAMETQT
jgi:hypothetical protein